MNDTICIYFHNIGLPLQRMINGDHFGYMEPIQEPPVVMGFNTIKAIVPDRRENWTESDITELYRCYYLAEHIKPNVMELMYNIWRKRNPTVRREMTSISLRKKTVLHQNRLTQSQKNNIF